MLLISNIFILNFFLRHWYYKKDICLYCI